MKLRAVAHIDSPSGNAPIAAVLECDIRIILDGVVRTVRAIARAVDHFYRRRINSGVERTRETGTVVVGDEGRTAFDVHVVATVATIPLKGVLAVILDGERRSVFEVEFVVAAEVNCMRFASGSRTVHSKRSAIERKGCALACAHRLPIPFGGIRGGANTGHAGIDVLEHERMAPKGNALVGELQRVTIAIDGEVHLQVKASGLGILKQRNRLTVLCGCDSLIKRVVLGLVDTCHATIGIGARRQNQRADKCHGKHRHQARRASVHTSFKLHFVLPISISGRSPQTEEQQTASNIHCDGMRF